MVSLFSKFQNQGKPKKPGSAFGEEPMAAELSTSLAPEDLSSPPILAEERKPSLHMGDDSSPDYSYGLEAPKAEKGKWWETALNYLVPTMIGMSEGHGLLPSAGISFLANQAGKAEARGAGREAYDKERTFRQKDRSIDAEAGLKRDQIEALNDYRGKTLKISKQNADANTIRSGKTNTPTQTEFEKVAAAESRIQKAKAEGRIPDDQDLAMVELYKSIKYIE